MTSRLAIAIATVLALATSAAAQPAKPGAPLSTFDAKVTAIGPPAGFLCGRAMALQDMTLTVTKVDSGAIKVGSTATLHVLTCFGGHLLRPIPKIKAPVLELDPAKIRVGSVIHVDADDLDKNAWIVEVDKITVLAFAPGAAQPATARINPRSTFDGTVTAIGTAMPHACGYAMATQDVTLTVTKVDSGAMKVGATPTIRVLTCFGGHLLRPIAKSKAELFELDPSKIRVGSIIHIDAEDLAKGAWFATTDKITVTKL